LGKKPTLKNEGKRESEGNKIREPALAKLTKEKKQVNRSVPTEREKHKEKA